MDIEKHMIGSLSALLKNNEYLQISFYGSLHTGSLSRPKEYICFFGLVGNDLLVVSYSPASRNDGFSVRVPLHIKQVEIKKAVLREKYRISFWLDQAQWPFERFHIIAKRRHPQIASQEESVSAFLSYIEKLT